MLRAVCEAAGPQQLAAGGEQQDTKEPRPGRRRPVHREPSPPAPGMTEVEYGYCCARARLLRPGRCGLPVVCKQGVRGSSPLAPLVRCEMRTLYLRILAKYSSKVQQQRARDTLHTRSSLGFALRAVAFAARRSQVLGGIRATEQGTLSLGPALPVRRPAGYVVNPLFQGGSCRSQRVSGWQAISVTHGEISRDAASVHEAQLPNRSGRKSRGVRGLPRLYVLVLCEAGAPSAAIGYAVCVGSVTSDLAGLRSLGTGGR